MMKAFTFDLFCSYLREGFGHCCDEMSSMCCWVYEFDGNLVSLN